MYNIFLDFLLDTIGEQTVELPNGAEILSVRSEGERLRMWVMVNPQNQKTLRTFHIFGTEAKVPPAERKFIQSFQLPGNWSMFHLFEAL